MCLFTVLLPVQIFIWLVGDYSVLHYYINRLPIESIPVLMKKKVYLHTHVLAYKESIQTRRFLVEVTCGTVTLKSRAHCQQMALVDTRLSCGFIQHDIE